MFCELLIELTIVFIIMEVGRSLMIISVQSLNYAILI